MRPLLLTPLFLVPIHLLLVGVVLVVNGAPMTIDGLGGNEKEHQQPEPLADLDPKEVPGGPYGPDKAPKNHHTGERPKRDTIEAHKVCAC
jgi:hypothetical protein